MRGYILETRESIVRAYYAGIAMLVLAAAAGVVIILISAPIAEEKFKPLDIVPYLAVCPLACFALYTFIVTFPWIAGLLVLIVAIIAVGLSMTRRKVSIGGVE